MAIILRCHLLYALEVQLVGDSTEKHRFGFNSKERDDETYGDGDEIAFESRITRKQTMRKIL